MNILMILKEPFFGRSAVYGDIQVVGDTYKINEGVLLIADLTEKALVYGGIGFRVSDKVQNLEVLGGATYIVRDQAALKPFEALL